jgi:hypothetical protein
MVSMRRCSVLLLFVVCLLTGLSFPLRRGNQGAGKPVEALHATRFKPLPLGRITPRGWLRTQLQIQADGLTGKLDQFWPDVKESGWIGGSSEGWERMPYWLDGALPLAYLLRDEGLIQRIEKDIDYILTDQNEDGWLGPERSPGERYKARDPWPVFVMMKVLTQYAEATGDPRVEPALARFLRRLEAQMKERPLFDWNRMRWQDGVLSVFWLYDRTGEAWLLELAARMQDQGFDWIAHFRDLPYKRKVERWEHESHVVNNAMGVKTSAIRYRQTGNESYIEEGMKAVAELDRYHGQASGLFSGDECFAGLMPSQGTETCAVVEYMFSLETLASGADPRIGDRLERIAYNALPASVTSDGTARQYVQQANQALVRVSSDNIYTTNGPEANIYGLETNFGCCTANMHQGWPKLVSHLWMLTDDGGIAAVSYGPSVVRTEIGNLQIEVETITDYPFGDSLEFVLKTPRPGRFPIWLRIPAWAGETRLSVEGEQDQNPQPGSYVRLEREWASYDRIRLEFSPPVRAEKRFNGAVSLSRGPLLFSLEIGTAWRKVHGEEPWADWEVYPTTQWNYALAVDPSSPGDSVEVIRRAMPACPLCPGKSPTLLRVKGRLLPEWTLEKNAAEAPPVSPVKSEQPLEDLNLIPYGAAKLRITEFPYLEME